MFSRRNSFPKNYLILFLHLCFLGIAKTQTQRRHLKVEAKQMENIERLQNLPKRSEIEKKMRDDALAKPVSENSKGFLLLSKMGYKPGMSLGVEREGNYYFYLFSIETIEFFVRT